MMQCAEEEVSNAPPTAIEPNTGASRLQASEQPVVQNCSRESAKKHCGSWNRTSLWLVHRWNENSPTFLQVSIRHKYPFGQIDVPMTDFMQDLWNDRYAGHNSLKFVGMPYYCSESIKHFIFQFDRYKGHVSLSFQSDRYSLYVST